MKPSVFVLGLLLLGSPAAAQAMQTGDLQTSPGLRLRLDPQVAQARISVLIPEEIIRRYVPDPAAETEIMRALIEAGYRVVDPGTQKRNAERNLLRGQDLNAIPDLRTRLNADYLVTGEAFAEEYGAVSQGVRGYTARLEVKVIDLASGQIVYSKAFQGSGVGATDAVAGKTALMNVGRMAGRELPGLLNEALQGKSSVAQRAYVLRILTPASFTEVNALAARLKAQPGIGDVMIRSVDSSGALLEIVSAESAPALAARLETLGLAVSGLTGNEISVRF
ncbi:MAG: hypothetical protein Q4C67_08050 [Deinococcus sp.]|nr:hypothetical protein [Deinococcus sp.]